jgi:integrase
VPDELLASNPPARIKQPAVPSTGGHHLSIAEVAYPPLLRLLAAKSLRHGEALAAGWSDADLTNGLLRVRGTL